MMSKVRKGIVVLLTAAVCAVVPMAVGETSASAATVPAAKTAVPKVVRDAGPGDVLPCGRGSTWQ